MQGGRRLGVVPGPASLSPWACTRMFEPVGRAVYPCRFGGRVLGGTGQISDLDLRAVRRRRRRRSSWRWRKNSRRGGNLPDQEGVWISAALDSNSRIINEDHPRSRSPQLQSPSLQVTSRRQSFLLPPLHEPPEPTPISTSTTLPRQPPSATPSLRPLALDCSSDPMPFLDVPTHKL